jgi:hypothetical protein
MLRALRAEADGSRVAVLQRFFRTQPGQYAEGDRFIGVTVPAIRRLTRRFSNAPLEEVDGLLHSPVHEARLLALLLMVRSFRAGRRQAASPHLRSVSGPYKQNQQLGSRRLLCPTDRRRVAGGSQPGAPSKACAVGIAVGVGWMLREAGKQRPHAERRFLASRHLRMPRTMLRYAIEKFPERQRRAYLTARP